MCRTELHMELHVERIWNSMCRMKTDMEPHIVFLQKLHLELHMEIHVEVHTVLNMKLHVRLHLEVHVELRMGCLPGAALGKERK